MANNYGNRDTCVYAVFLFEQNGKTVRYVPGFDARILYPDGRHSAKRQRQEIKKWMDKSIAHYKDKSIRPLGFIPKWMDPEKFVTFNGEVYDLHSYVKGINN